MSLVRNEKEEIMRLAVRTFAVVTLFCAVTCEASQAAAIAPIGAIRKRSTNITHVYLHHRQGYSYHYWHRRYGYRPYWWPQAGTIGPLMAQNAGIIGGINKLRSAEPPISGSGLEKVWNLRDAAATKRRSSPAFDDLNQVP